MPAKPEPGHARRGVLRPQPAGLAEPVVERERRPRGQALGLPGGRVDDQLDRAVAAQVAVAEAGQAAVQPLAQARPDLGPVQPGPGVGRRLEHEQGGVARRGGVGVLGRGVGDEQARVGLDAAVAGQGLEGGLPVAAQVDGVVGLAVELAGQPQVDQVAGGREVEPAPLHPPVPGRRGQQVGVGGRQVAGDDHVPAARRSPPASTTPVTPPGPPSTRSTRVESRRPPRPSRPPRPGPGRGRACRPGGGRRPRRRCPCGRPRRRCRGRRTATGRCRGPGRCGPGAAASRSGGWRPGCAAAGSRPGGPAAARARGRARSAGPSKLRSMNGPHSASSIRPRWARKAR